MKNKIHVHCNFVARLEWDTLTGGKDLWGVKDSASSDTSSLLGVVIYKKVARQAVNREAM